MRELFRGAGARGKLVAYQITAYRVIPSVCVNNMA